MKLRKLLRSVASSSKMIVRSPRSYLRELENVSELVGGSKFARNWDQTPRSPDGGAASKKLPPNPLREYFDKIETGPGIWKWQHYFEIYHRHLAKFVGRRVSLAEVGVYSGGSLHMWREYFGAECTIQGIDIQPACKAYENDYTTIHIGDQADRHFWKEFRDSVGSLDILIDDGGHAPEQQRITLEETLPWLNAGGVYICEDVHGIRNPFAAFARSFVDGLNAFVRDHDSQFLGALATPLQSTIHSVHLYPFMVIIEKTEHPVLRFDAPKHGTQWQPFFRRAGNG